VILFRPGGATRGILDGKVENGLISDSELQGGSTDLCWLRIALVIPCCNKHWVVHWCIRDLWGPANLVALTIAELDDTPLYFTNDIGIVFGPPTDYRWDFHVEDGTRVRWTCLESLIVGANGGHSWYLCVSCVSCCQVISLIRWLLIQIFMMPSDMGEACSLCTNIEVIYHYVHMKFMIMFNYDYLVVENNDTKNSWLSYQACLA
jgi:hypothetical protein